MPAGLALVVAFLVSAVGNATAQGDAGTVASVLGAVQVRRVGAEAWEQTQPGTSFETEADLRTGPRSAAPIVLHDGSVLEMAAATEISAVQVAQVPTGKRFLSLVRLLEGKLHVLVGEQYGLEGSRFEVRLPRVREALAQA